MDSPTSLYLLNFLAVVGMMVAGWLASLAYRNVTVVDSLWGTGFVLIAWLTFFMADGFFLRQWIVVGATTLWGVRLAVHLTRRNWGAGEDPRYGKWRERSGSRFWIVSLVKVFLLQAVVLWLISLVIQFGMMAPEPARITWLDAAGVIVFAVGFFFEAVGDRQLASFKADPTNRGKVMNRGLWAYSRHPNYFGECLIWWGLFLVTLSTPGGAWAVVSPILVTLVLLKMTGIPLTEQTIVEKRPAYRHYIETTSAFVPWFPKKGRGDDGHTVPHGG